MIKLSDYMAQFFEQQGVKDVFMLSGGGCMHLINSFGSSKKMKYWCLHHEQSVSMATEAYSRAKNDLCVAVVTCGPGATNTITGLLGAYQDSSPCVFLSGQAKRKNTVRNSGLPGLRQLGQQEVDIIPIVSSITKYAVMINDPNEIRYHLEKAVYLAKNGRPGPVWIDVPLDVQNSMIDETALNGYEPEETIGAVNPEDIDYLIDLLNKSERPVIVAGHGVRIANACKELRDIVEKYSIPVVNSFLGIDVLESDHPCSIGRIGIKGTRAGNFTMQNADLLISIGSRLSVSSIGFQPELFARGAKVVVVDIDEVEHKKDMVAIDRLIISDAKLFINALLPQMESRVEKNYKNWLDKADKWKDAWPVCLPQYDNDTEGINYYKMIDLLNKYMTADMPVVSDAGSAFYVTSQSVNLKKGQRYIPSGALATMGYTLPAAIGVAISDLSKTVVGIVGDGSLQQNIQELIVLKAHNLPVKLVVMNNDGYLSIRQTQRKFFKDNFVAEGPHSGVIFPKTEDISKAYGLDYYYIDTIKKAEELLPVIFSKSGPSVIEVKTLPFQEIIPTSSSAMKKDGTMVSKPLEDMYPFLDRETFLNEMIVKSVEE